MTSTAQQKANDQVSTNNWITEDSGKVWSTAQAEKNPQESTARTAAPSADDLKPIGELNAFEAAIASIAREKRHVYQKIFFRWWNAMEVRGTAFEANQQKHKNAIASILGELKRLDDATETASKGRQEAKSRLPNTLVLEEVSAPPFGVRQDFTVLFTGVSSGWPSGYIDNVQVRLSSQLAQKPDLGPFSRQLGISDWEDLLSRLRNDKTLTELQGFTDYRSFCGRSPITPQASSALKSRIRQLFARAQPAEQKKADVDALLEQVSEVEYFFAPLAGIKDHLTTLIQGYHARPHAEDALLAGELGLSETDIRHVVASSNQAPYGKLAQIRGHGVIHEPLKPVTHGQFVFTKLHIVDKFGQIVSYVEPATLDSPRTALYPCLSRHFF
ncbi:hypothetical protein CDEST_15341 [Colletotrichum destructivum]|uniref:Uncharacterized protein n=1 Tax=Colletotrichum destructivum TaxID=34406 RepID=A0AAX4J4L5_9PEZI|nr:hypothetical protein CDEST_15341 [Colletotrichum destructivum]